LIRAVCEKFCTTKRRGFADILSYMARNRSEFVVQKIRKAPKLHLVSAREEKAGELSAQGHR